MDTALLTSLHMHKSPTYSLYLRHSLLQVSAFTKDGAWMKRRGLLTSLEDPDLHW